MGKAFPYGGVENVQRPARYRVDEVFKEGHG